MTNVIKFPESNQRPTTPSTPSPVAGTPTLPSHKPDATVVDLYRAALVTDVPVYHYPKGLFLFAPQRPPLTLVPSTPDPFRSLRPTYEPILMWISTAEDAANKKNFDAAQEYLGLALQYARTAGMQDLRGLPCYDKVIKMIPPKLQLVTTDDPS